MLGKDWEGQTWLHNTIKGDTFYRFHEEGVMEAAAMYCKVLEVERAV